MPAKQSKSLLLVEDSEEDFEAFRRMMQKASVQYPIFRCVDGDEALDFLYHTGDYTHTQSAPRPSLIVIDLNLPGTSGREVIEQIKQDETLKSIPVVVFTTSSNPKDVEKCYEIGANTYIIKPIDIERLKRSIQMIFEYWLDIAILPDDESLNF